LNLNESVMRRDQSDARRVDRVNTNALQSTRIGRSGQTDQPSADRTVQKDRCRCLA